MTKEYTFGGTIYYRVKRQYGTDYDWVPGKVIQIFNPGLTNQEMEKFCKAIYNAICSCCSDDNPIEFILEPTKDPREERPKDPPMPGKEYADPRDAFMDICRARVRKAGYTPGF